MKTPGLFGECDSPGIRAIEHRLFKPFFQVENNAPGAGLGLAIVHAIAEAHRAEIRLDNSAPRHAVTVTWPSAEK